MFKGINKEESEGLEKMNQKSPFFKFSFADLELVKIDGKRRKCRIISEELSNIYSKGKKGYIPPIRFIDLDLTEREDKFEFFHFEVSSKAYPFGSKMEVHEESLNKETKVLSDGTLVIPFMKEKLLTM